MPGSAASLAPGGDKEFSECWDRPYHHDLTDTSSQCRSCPGPSRPLRAIDPLLFLQGLSLETKHTPSAYLCWKIVTSGYLFAFWAFHRPPRFEVPGRSRGWDENLPLIISLVFMCDGFGQDPPFPKSVGAGDCRC